jgi:thiamine biosynthesis lipoprotein
MHRAALTRKLTMDALISPRRRELIAGIGAFGAVALAGCDRTAAPDGALVRLTGATMGSTYTLKIARGTFSPTRLNELHAGVQAALDDVERRMSLYRADSELTRFNRHASAAPFAMSAELFSVFAQAAGISRLSDGAFDVTVAPLVETWGFGTEKRQQIPAAARVQSSRATVGYRSLQLDPQTRRVTKLRPDAQADLGGIAKGFGVDRAARVLDEAGVDHYMLEAGGEVRTRGVNAQSRPWRIGIEEPDAMPQRARRVVPLSGQSLATSGDYRIYFERDGRRYSHEIDPATAAPIAHGLASVSVAASDCMRADALATALIVLGPQRGWALAQREGIAAHFIVRDAQGRLHDRTTDAFASLTASA